MASVNGGSMTMSGGTPDLTYYLWARDSGGNETTWTSTDPASSPPIPAPVAPWAEKAILCSY